jgi:DNA-binding CsgD family transcriptional regulator
MLIGARRRLMVEKPALVGRERELQELVRFLDAVPSGPVGLLFEGDAGIGKTTLWREAVSAALNRSYFVLSCRPVESEAQLAFTALGDLLEEVPDSATAELPVPQRRALEVALLQIDAEGPPPLPRAVSLGVLGVLRALAASGPLVIALDDLQWLDRPSASTLEFAARRLRGEPIGFVLSRRGAEADVPLALDQTFPPDAVRRLLIGPLDGDSLGRLIRSRFDIHLGPPALRQLEAASGGNPYFAIELARSLAERDIPLGPGEPLPVPGTLRALLGVRLADLAPETHGVTLAASALARPTVALVEASVRSVDPSAALAAAVAAGLLELDRDRVRFAHPLIASVVYADADAAERRALHAHIAEVVEEPEERARHLALATDAPNEEVAVSLDEAARSVRARGAPGDAAELYEEARRLTPPLQTDDAARRAVDAAECHFEGGDFGRVRALLEEVTAGTHSAERARALAFLGWVRAHQEGFGVGADIFRAALEAVGPDIPQRIEIERGLAWSLHNLGDLHAAEIHSRAALEMAERLAEPSILARAIANMALHEAVTGGGDPLSRIESALALDDPGEWQTALGRPRWIHALILQWRGELEPAQAALDEMYRAAVDRGDEHSLPYIFFYLARVDLLRGRFESASAYAQRQYEAAVETGQESERPFGLTIKALVDAHLGRVEAAREATDEGMPLALRLGVVPAYLELRAARGFLELSLASYEEAHRFLGPLREEVAKAGFGEPALFRFHGDSIEALIALGKLEEAASLIGELEERGEALEHGWARVISARCRGLLAAAGGDLPAAFSALERAFELHESVGQPFELARTHLVMGTIRRRSRQKRAARDSLQAALNSFEQIGARLWAERARAELARIGGRALAEDALTPTEQRVAELVAAGGTYREVADALFISPKTVQWNLSKIYRKLGIRSRSQLAGSLAAGRGDESTPAGPPVPP